MCAGRRIIGRSKGNSTPQAIRPITVQMSYLLLTAIALTAWFTLRSLAGERQRRLNELEVQRQAILNAIEAARKTRRHA